MVMNSVGKYIVGMLGTALLFAGCEKRTGIPASVEPLTGNCIGVVKDNGGTPTAGASVLLMSRDYAPASADGGSGTIDSAVTDEHGRYGFTVEKSGTFNILAECDSRYGFVSDVEIVTDAKAEDDIILGEPGAVSGTVHLQGHTDHQPVVILFPGTNRYTTPTGAGGGFSIGALAEGTYRMRMVTTEPGFFSVDTTITVTAGKTTALPVIELPSSSLPVRDLIVTYDPMLMRAMLSWHPVDTTRITGYAVYLNRESNLQPIRTVAKSDSNMIYEVIVSPVDTFTFQVAAVRTDGTVGEAAVAEKFVKTSDLMPGKKFSFPTFEVLEPLLSMSVDIHGNIFLYHEGIVGELDSNGTVLGSYRADFFEGFDDAGHVYVANDINNDTLTLVRLNALLQPEDELICHLYKPANYMNVEIAVTPEGRIFVVKDSVYNKAGNDPVYWVSEYESDFNFISRYRHEGALIVDQTYNSYSNIKNWEFFYSDTLETMISALKNFEFCNAFLPEGYRLDHPPCPGPGGLIAGICSSVENVNQEPRFIIIFTTAGNVVARFPLISFDFCFDRAGNFYQASITNKTDTIVRYPTAGLIGAGFP